MNEAHSAMQVVDQIHARPLGLPFPDSRLRRFQVLQVLSWVFSTQSLRILHKLDIHVVFVRPSTASLTYQTAAHRPFSGSSSSVQRSSPLARTLIRVQSFAAIARCTSSVDFTLIARGCTY
jgi:hypothetical protein